MEKYNKCKAYKGNVIYRLACVATLAFIGFCTEIYISLKKFPLTSTKKIVLK